MTHYLCILICITIMMFLVVIVVCVLVGTPILGLFITLLALFATFCFLCLMSTALSGFLLVQNYIGVSYNCRKYTLRWSVRCWFCFSNGRRSRPRGCCCCWDLLLVIFLIQMREGWNWGDCVGEMEVGGQIYTLAKKINMLHDEIRWTYPNIPAWHTRQVTSMDLVAFDQKTGSEIQLWYSKPFLYYHNAFSTLLRLLQSLNPNCWWDCEALHS